jgi:hypothetical protein
MVAAVLTTAIVIVGAYWWSKASHIDTLPAVVPAAETQVKNLSASATAETLPALEKLKGKWLRPDGGYILEIRNAAPDGKMEAAYFNPRPIHVAKAEASREGENLKVFVELRDVNYPGSTYTLVYDATNDQLKGDYFQAALKQTFDVYFTRVQP